ncbi:MAG: hypothetical protein ACI3XI_02520 [Eubacteriales bacterium]
MEKKQKKYSLIALILEVIAIALPVTVVCLLGMGMDFNASSQIGAGEEIDVEAMVGAVLYALAYSILLILALTFTCAVSGGLALGAYKLSDTALALTPDGETRPTFPVISKIAAVVELVLFVIAIIAGVAAMIILIK